MIKFNGVNKWFGKLHVLQDIDLHVASGEVVVICGPSGSGKSSLAMDTIYAEGQRRYVETFSPYARQFLDRMDRPAADRIEGIPPAIALQAATRNAARLLGADDRIGLVKEGYEASLLLVAPICYGIVSVNEMLGRL